MRTAEDVAIGRFFQYGGSMQNYYMYHGGTNFGRTSGLFENYTDIQITRVKKVCAKPYAGSTLELSCHDRTIKDIDFVSFGNPRGNCDNFQKGTCDSSTALCH
ncbi:hypothetical protein Csa_003787 [Cucumis sativus]|uniref:beta-galactosidase n=1 Tax=Cucumis sativus TaxID=3659 RepID=A0A0A0KET4_CUCSA|nr:hypothetical protein Csa_003787 [Cucumis sativus]